MRTSRLTKPILLIFLRQRYA
ncbi:hypothetical protein CY0110_16662 [Crocosphaera chwakensis CCY0110]|uniref:Uncharacterized protein n=1 Tax=Crocosphaera chwakensis CCY0110 TaxID=391612 RepID=A3II14_9CHRO|nr:hypothetical protein CY0110_16662 [Crocosphaera chwakensis CCY0110]